ncbi:MAG: hypothetical protein IPG66_05425 [Hydrogenophilales bacterium]|nr:hypothetical protein [Hydrogenophilales bacterium]
MKKLMREYESLCTLGLPANELVPIAVDLMERIMPGTYFCFTRANAQFAVIDCYMKDPIPDEYARVYAEEFHDRLEGEAGPTFTEMLRDRIPLVNYSAPGSRFFDTALYARIFQPLGLRHGARVAVIEGEQRHGTISVSRPEGSAAFSADEEQVLLRMARYLAHALELERLGRLVNGDAADSVGQGVLVLDREGAILHGCLVGLRLFHEATRHNGTGQQPHATRATLPASLAARAASAADAGEIILQNHRGQFGFRPALMRTHIAGATSTVAVTVRRRGSIASRLWLESERFPLSSRERQIAVLLGAGYGYEAIAEHLDLTRNTAVSYVRRTYEKLGINQREQLIRALLAAPAEALPEEVPA